MVHVESPGDGAAALAGGQAPECLRLLVFTELERAALRGRPKFERPAQTEQSRL